MGRLIIALCCVVVTTASGQFKNIKLAEEVEGVSAVPSLGTSITISQKDPKNIVVGIGPNRAVYTLDGGNTWSESLLQSPFGAQGDPALISDLKGHICYLHLSGVEPQLDRIVCQRSEDRGKTWDAGSFIGNNPPAAQAKAWLTVHPKKQIMYATWTQFDKYGIDDVNCHSNILFSISTNGGGKWHKPVQISQTPGDCQDGEKTSEGAVPAVGINGRIYVTWANQGIIFFDRSYNGGETWLTNDIPITKQLGGWSMEIPGLKRASGRPVLMIDNSPSRAQGSLYVAFADQKDGPDNTDIWFTRSTSRGDNWVKPIRVNSDDSRTHQFMPWMTVDQTTGRIYIIYYDRREHEDLQTDVYLAFSSDGGNVFKEVKISETPFAPTDAKPFSENTNIAAFAGIVTPVWTRMDNGKLSVWTAVIKEDDLLELK